MYPKIFNKTEVEFTTNGLGFLSDATKVLVTEERNGGFYLEMEYPLNGQNAKYLKYDYIILAKPNPVDKPQPFRIYDTKKSKNNRNILVKANHITFDDANNFLLNFSRSKTPANVLLDQMTKSKTQKNKITYSTNIDTAITVDWSKRSPVNAIAGEQGSFIQALNSEIKRDMWKVTVNTTRGRKSSYVARDEKGLTEFDYEEDISGVVTKLYPFKTYKPDNSDKDKTIELKEKYIVSDNADKYPFERIAYLDLSQDDKIKNEDDLRKAALKKFTQEHIDLPKISGTLKVLNLSNNPEYSFIGNLSSVLLCDYIWCVSKTIQEKVQVQVNKVVYNPILEDYDSIDVGMKKQSLAQSINNSINNVQNQVTNIQNQVTNIVDRGDGTKSITSVEEPTEEQYDLNDGDLWFQELPNGDMNIWVWDDTQKIWKPVFSKEDFNKYMEEAQKAKEDALNAINKADEAVQNANLANSNLAKFEDEVTGEFVKINGNFNGLQTQVGDLEESTQTSITQLDKLIQLQASQIGPIYPDGTFNEKDTAINYNSDATDGAYIGISNHTLILHNSATSKANALTKSFIAVNSAEPLSIKFEAQFVGDVSNCFVYLHEFNDNKTEINTPYQTIFSFSDKEREYHKLEKKFNLNSKTKYIKIEWVAWNDNQTHSITELSIRNVSLINGDNTLSGSINVAIDSASMAVKTDKVISAVNASKEGVQIYGEKVHISGKTTIDDAVIKDAMIANLSANKLTAGTIDASKIKVINLDVNTLTGNKSKFLETIWADNNSYSKITPDGMRFYKSADGILQKDSYLNIYSNELKWKTSEPQWHYISEATERGLSLLTIGAVTGKGIEPASIAIKSSGYNNLAVANQNGYFSGKYLFLGNVLTTIPQTEGQRKASTDLCNINGFFGIDDTKCYRIAMTAANDISLMVSDTKGGGKINFYNGGGIDSYSSCFEYRTDNGIGMMLKSRPIYSRTYSSSANLFITENGYIGRSTSARKYKENIEYIDNLEEAKRVLDIQPAEWADKEQMMSHARARAGISKPEDEERLTRRYIGFIADDFADAGFEKLITRDKTGEVEEFQYNRLSVYHHQLIKDLYNQVEELKTEIKELKEK